MNVGFEMRPPSGVGRYEEITGSPDLSYWVFFEDSKVFDVIFNADAFGVIIDGFDYSTARTGMDFYGRTRYIGNNIKKDHLDQFKEKLISHCKASLAASGEGKVVGKLYVGNQPSRNVIFFPRPSERLVVICEIDTPITSFLTGFYTSIDEMSDIICNYELRINAEDTRW